jgi:hypothetical protein
MPRGDKTGPNGQGAMTGRKMGLCTGNSNAGYVNSTESYGFGRQGRGFGLGIRNGRGRGFGFSRGFAENTNSTNPSNSENQQLRNEISKLQSRLNDLEKKS